MESEEVSEKCKAANVLVATPNYTNEFSSEIYTSHIQCAVDWTKMGLRFNMTVVGRTFVHFARRQLVDLALTGEWTHILWLDDDAVIDPEILPKFLEFDKDVMIAPYPMRRPTYAIGVLRSTAYKCPECDWYGHLIWSYETESVLALDKFEKAGHETYGPIGCPPNDDEVVCPTCGHDEGMFRDFHNHRAYKNLSASHNLDRGVMEVDGGGTHCMLVNCDVFHRRGEKSDSSSLPTEAEEIVGIIKSSLGPEQIDKYDRYLGEIMDETSTFSEEDQAGKPYFVMPKTGTEDMHWCYRAKRKKIDIYCDTDSFAPHIGFPPVITRAFRDQIEAQGHEIGGKSNSKESVQITQVSDAGGAEGAAMRKDVVSRGRVGNLV